MPGLGNDDDDDADDRVVLEWPSGIEDVWQ